MRCRQELADRRNGDCRSTLIDWFLPRLPDAKSIRLFFWERIVAGDVSAASTQRAGFDMRVARISIKAILTSSMRRNTPLLRFGECVSNA
jgi:hypothetical protein